MSAESSANDWLGDGSLRDQRCNLGGHRALLELVVGAVDVVRTSLEKISKNCIHFCFPDETRH